MHMISPDRTRFCCHILTYLVKAKFRFPTRGPQCYAVNCYNYKNELSKAKGITFHK